MTGTAAFHWRAVAELPIHEWAEKIGVAIPTLVLYESGECAVPDEIEERMIRVADRRVREIGF